MSADPGRRSQAIFDAAPDGIVVVDPAGAIQDLNPAAERMFRWDRADLIGRPVEVLVPPAARGAHVGQRERYAAHPRARPMGVGMELSGVRRDGSVFPVEISLSPVELDGATSVIAVVRDVTERKRLREFGAGALRAAEEERQRIARELHDDTAQVLAALLVRLQLATRAEDPGVRERMFEEIRRGIEGAADSVRRIAHNLRPPMLELGVVGAIRAQARSLREAYGFVVEVEAPDPEPRLAPDRELALYRIVQEALSNAVRHGGAEGARVAFAFDGATVAVAVVDAGRGFDPAAVERGTRGLGLLGMRERARNAGGELEIESAPGSGTRVRLRLPIDPS